MDKNDDNEFTENDDSLITPAEKAMLDEILRNDPLSEDEIELKKSQLDNIDDDGDFLNELNSANDASGNDLDIPGAEDDDDEEIGREDEENNGYSKADTE